MKKERRKHKTPTQVEGKKRGQSLTNGKKIELNIQETKIMATSPITSWQIDGETMEIVRDFILGAPISLQIVTAAMKLKDVCSLKE